MTQVDSTAAFWIDTQLQDSPVAVRCLPWPRDCGAETLFVGRTRAESHPRFGPLVRLEYEAYDPMAAKLLDRMAHEAVRKFGCRAVYIAHACGRVAVGQASVVIQVACPHRVNAFAACRYLIERIKRELPIWKRQVWHNGETFVDGTQVTRSGEADDGSDG